MLEDKEDTTVEVPVDLVDKADTVVEDLVHKEVTVVEVLVDLVVKVVKEATVVEVPVPKVDTLTEVPADLEDKEGTVAEAQADLVVKLVKEATVVEVLVDLALKVVKEATVVEDPVDLALKEDIVVVLDLREALVAKEDTVVVVAVLETKVDTVKDHQVQEEVREVCLAQVLEDLVVTHLVDHREEDPVEVDINFDYFFVDTKFIVCFAQSMIISRHNKVPLYCDPIPERYFPVSG